MASHRFLLAVVASCMAASPAAADQVVATTSAPTPVAGWNGTAAFSVKDATGGFQLAVWSAADGLRTAPVPDRPQPFDADVGPDAGGATVVVYSRCRTYGRHPAGCALYRWTIGAPREQTIAGTGAAGTSQSRPSIWRDALAWVRTSAHGARVLFRASASARPRVLPGVPTTRCAEFDEMWLLRPCNPTTDRSIESLDLAARRVALVVAYDFPNAAGFRHSEVRIDDLAGGAEIAHLLTTGEGGQTFAGAAFAAGDLYWTLTCLGDPSGCSARTAGTLRLSEQGRYARAGFARPLWGSAPLGGGRMIEVRDASEARDCRAATPAGACPIVVTDPLAFVAARRAPHHRPAGVNPRLRYCGTGRSGVRRYAVNTQGADCATARLVARSRLAGRPVSRWACTPVRPMQPAGFSFSCHAGRDQIWVFDPAHPPA